MSGRPRFFVDEEPELAARLSDYLAGLAGDLERQKWKAGVAALVLSGGYGRGEGGVFRESADSPPQLYNDVEFFLFLNPGADRGAVAQWCSRHEREGTAQLGVDVEFKCDDLGALSSGPPTMFWHDLLQGHHVVWGKMDFAARARPEFRDPAMLPPEEATRLLFNRGSGLWFASCRLRKGEEDRDGFIERNQMKARLALADAVLALAGKHHGLCQERGKRIRQGGFSTPPGWEKLVAWHEEAVAFKLRPRHRRPGIRALEMAQRELVGSLLKVFLWVESQRLHRSFTEPAGYWKFRARLYPKTPPTRNVLLHLRDRIRRGEVLPLRFWGDYPRATLQRALVAALGGDIASAALLLGVPANSFEPAYQRWWARYN